MARSSTNIVGTPQTNYGLNIGWYTYSIRSTASFDDSDSFICCVALGQIGWCGYGSSDAHATSSSIIFLSESTDLSG